MRDTPLTIMSMMGEEVIPITVTTNLHHGKGSDVYKRQSQGSVDCHDV